VAAASANWDLKSSSDPKSALMRSATSPLGAPPPVGDMQLQKNVWFHVCAALLNFPPSELRMISSRDLPSSAVPSIALFRFVT
jgi:hypothetical protein